MTAGTITAAVILYQVPGYRRRLPAEIAAAGPVRIGALLGSALWLGELPNSFLKRRVGIPPGGRRGTPAGAVISLVDQADWVPTACLLLRPVWRISAAAAARTFIIVAAAHVPINMAGYAIGARTTAL